MESLLTKVYSRCSVVDSKAATNPSSSDSIPGNGAAVAQASFPSHQQKSVIPRPIQCHEKATSPPPHGVAPPFRSLDAATDHDSDTDSTRLHIISVVQHQSSAGKLPQAAAGVSNLPPQSAVTLHDQGTRSELESADDATASKELFVDQRSSPASGEPVIGQILNEGDVSMSRQEMESFELLDVSDFENDNSSESLPPSPPSPPSPLQTRPTLTSPNLTTAETTATGSNTNKFQLNQSKTKGFAVMHMMCQ